MANIDTNNLLQNLSPEEKEIAMKLLQDISHGDNSAYNKLLYDDYVEIPVDIDTFLDNDIYLGKALRGEDGKSTVFPYWREMLRKIFPDPLKPPKYHTLALSGAIGLGKSFIAVICGLYQLYKVLCLKDPYLYYGIQSIDTITFAFMNITLDASRGVAWGKCQQLLQSSEWFMQHGSLRGTTNLEWEPPKGIELISGSQSRHILGRAVFFCFFDEISFRIGTDIGKQKAQAKELVNTADVRMQSRFMKGDKNPTLLCLASSKRTESSYMEEFIANKRKQNKENTYIVDEPQWVIRTDKDSKYKFKVAVGNKYLDSEVLSLGITDNEISEYRNRGYQILDVPMGYYENFMDDINVALTDIAGISTISSNRYFYGERIAKTKNTNYQNLFTKDVIEVGNSPKDTTQYWNFIDLSRLRTELKYKPLYIHMDMSVSGDKTGIAGVWIKGKKPPAEGEPPSKDLYYTLAFSVSVKAPKGFQISFEKNRQFIFWLKEQGFNIKAVTTDSFQSVDTGQTLSARGFNYSILSVDKVDSDHICKPYQYLRSAIYEERFEMYEAPLLTDELLGLERDNNSGKIDHSPSGINSKDQADAVCGATYRASQDAEEYAYEFGEDVEVVKEVNSQINTEQHKQQLIVNFQEELQKFFGEPPPSIQKQREQDKAQYQNYKAIIDGIIPF